MRLLPVLTPGTLMPPVAARAGDPPSYAQPDEVVVTHMDPSLAVDFAHKQLDGVTTLKLDWKNPTAPLYKAFVKTPQGPAHAEQIYAKAKAGHHPLTRQVVAAILAKAKQPNKAANQ